MIEDKLKNKSFLTLLTFTGLLVISLSCVSTTAPQANETVGGCTMLPEKFSESDLVGTWVSRKSVSKTSDTLIIREDGAYKQIITLEYQSIEYESDWQAWWFEYRDNGTGYLHLDDYRVCAVNTSYSCEWVNDGKRPYADVCEGQWIDPDPPAGEIILVVRGIPGSSVENRSHPFVLTLFQGFESSPWSYGFSEP